MARRDFWGLDDSIGYLARIIFRRFTGTFERLGPPPRIAAGQYALLGCLWRGDGIAQHDLAARLGLCEPTVAVTLRRLEAARLLRRTVNPSNRREMLVHLTDEGRAAQTSLENAWQTVHAVATKGFSHDEKATLHRLLCRVEESLATASADGHQPRG